MSEAAKSSKTSQPLPDPFGVLALRTRSPRRMWKPKSPGEATRRCSSRQRSQCPSQQPDGNGNEGAPTMTSASARIWSQLHESPCVRTAWLSSVHPRIIIDDNKITAAILSHYIWVICLAVRFRGRKIVMKETMWHWLWGWTVDSVLRIEETVSGGQWASKRL